MVVLEKKAAGGLDTDRAEVAERPSVTGGSGLRAYLLVGLAAVAIGVGAVIGANGLGLMGTDKLSPAQITEIRAQHLAEDLESRYWAQLADTNVQRARAMAEFHSRQHQARINWINEQRARAMVEFYSRQHQARINWINEQRAQDMVTFKRGWEGEADS